MDHFKHFLLTISNGPSSGNQLCSLIFTKHYQSLIVRFHTTAYSGASLRQRACRGAQLQGHPHLWGNHRWGCHQVSPTFSYIWSFGGKVASYFENFLHSKLPIPHWFPLFVWLIRLSFFVWLRAPAPVPVQTSQPRHANGRHWPDFYSRSLAPLVLPNILKPAIVLPIKMTMSSILAPIDNPSYIATHWILDQLPVIAQEVVYHEWLCRNGKNLEILKKMAKRRWQYLDAVSESVCTSGGSSSLSDTTKGPSSCTNQTRAHPALLLLHLRPEQHIPH